MEDRRLNGRESIELITRMMQNTKMNLEVGSGNSLIIWGVTIFTVNILAYLLLHLTQSPMSYWAWMLVPLIGTLWTKFATKNSPKVTTRIDKLISELWQSITIICVLLPIFIQVLAIQSEQQMLLSGYKLMTIIPFAEMLIVSIGLIASAIIIDFKPLRIGGMVGVMLSLTLLCDATYIHTIMIATWALASVIIPGIKLNYYIKSRKNA